MVSMENLESKYSLKTLTVGQIDGIMERMRPGLASMSFENISTIFLSQVMPIGTYDDFTQYRERYIHESDEDAENVPVDRYSFHAHICKKYFWLEREPKDCLISSFQITTGQLQKIDANLAEIKKEIQTIETGGTVEQKQNRRPLLEYFLEGNERAKQEILHFLIYEIEAFAANHAFTNVSPMASILAGQAYSYGWNPQAYEVREPHSLDNKFLELPIETIHNIKKMHRENQLAFRSFLKDFINEQEIIATIQGRFNQNHILNKRLKVVFDLLAAYENGHKSAFALGVITQIEGIIHDICSEFGVDESTLRSNGFSFKVKQLFAGLKREYYYEYYAFYLRVLRNKFAHGIAINDEVSDQADLLLLDLLQVSDFACNEMVPTNKKWILVQIIDSTQSGENYWSYLVEYLIRNETKIPAFYKSDDLQKKIDALLSQDFFWTCLEKAIASCPSNTEHRTNDDLTRLAGYANVLKILKKNEVRPEVCKSLRKSLSYTGKESIDDWDDFISLLPKYKKP